MTRLEEAPPSSSTTSKSPSPAKSVKGFFFNSISALVIRKETMKGIDANFYKFSINLPEQKLSSAAL